MSKSIPGNRLSPGLQTVPPITTPIQLPLTGTLPSFLSRSTLFRQGPGRYEATHIDGKQTNIRHWFDGYALVHAFAIDAHNNTVTYRSHFISHPVIRATESVKKADNSGFYFGRADPCKSLLGKFFQLWTSLPVDPETGRLAVPNINVTLQKIPGKNGIVARSDFDGNLIVDPDTLEAGQFFRMHTLGGGIKGNMTAAHGQYDEERGEFWNYSYELRGRREVDYQIYKIGPDGKGQVMATITDMPAYLHSFAITENYVILIVWPTVMNGLKVWWNRSVMDGIHWEAGRTAKFYVVKRDGGGLVAKYEAPPFYCFHTINSFEKDDSIHIDLSRYDNANVLDQLMLDYMRTETDFEQTTLTRFSLNSLSQAIRDGPGVMHEASETMLSGELIELARVNPKYQRKEYCYAYGASSSSNAVFSEVGKFDVKKGTKEVWSMPEGVVGEPIFVGDPDGVDEDDGVLLVVVLDSRSTKSCMVVLDAKSMTEVARAQVPQAVPLGFHGRFDMAE